MEKPYKDDNAGVSSSRVRFCDLRCEHAGQPRMEGLDGSCRTFASIWCAKLQKHVVKNAPCEHAFGARRPTTGL
jgi:hypothetical protein